MRLPVRALAAFLACPGVVAGILPPLIGRGPPQFGPWRPAGVALLAVGAACLLGCVRDFRVSGRGTLAPWDPPRALVVSGLYRHVRNPMYLAVLAVILGWTLVLGSGALAAYLCVVAVGFHLRVTLSEEPWLRRQFGSDSERYLATVPRWIPRIRTK